MMDRQLRPSKSERPNHASQARDMASHRRDIILLHRFLKVFRALTRGDILVLLSLLVIQFVLSGFHPLSFFVGMKKVLLEGSLDMMISWIVLWKILNAVLQVSFPAFFQVFSSSSYETPSPVPTSSHPVINLIVSPQDALYRQHADTVHRLNNADYMDVPEGHNPFYSPYSGPDTSLSPEITVPPYPVRDVVPLPHNGEIKRRFGPRFNFPRK